MRFLFFILLSTFLFAEKYELGHGLSLSKYLKVGSYISTKYKDSKDIDEFELDDIALLGYGSLSPKFSYLLELEAAGFYIKDLTNKKEETNEHFHIERAYFDYKFSDKFKIRVGKFITPIGYWNLVPITVLKDTTSNPLYSYKIFPRFTTGLNLYGFLSDDIEYNAFIQKSKDLDTGYNNIQTDDFIGLGLTKYFDDFSVSLGLGQFEDERLSERIYLDTSLKYKKSKVEVLAEAIVSRDEHKSDSDKYDSYALYLQGSYKFIKKHYLVSRYEYFKDNFDDYKEEIFLIGYNYRPIYPISIKGEYQFNSHSDLNKFIISLSILF